MGQWIWTFKSTVPADAVKKPLAEQWIFSIKKESAKSDNKSQ